MKTKNIILLTLLFISLNTIIYFITETNSKQRIDLVLKEDLNKLQIHFDILNTAQKNIAYAISQSIMRNTDAIKFLSESYTATEEQNNINREKLNTQLQEQYRIAKKQGVLQLQFVNRDNISFLRVHKPSKFGDDLTEIREDFKIVNETKEPIRGFTQGRTAHGFRNTFPLFDKNNVHIGAMEISFSSAKYQTYLNEVSNIHSHFLIDKQLFDTKVWEAKHLVISYEPSAEHKNLMLNLGPFHSKQICIVDNKKKLEPMREIIHTNTQKGEKFNFYIKNNKNIEIISFLPIKNLSNKTVAYIVSHSKSDIIKSSLTSTMTIRILSFFISLVIIYLIYRQIKSNIQIKIEKEKLQYKTNEQTILLTLFDQGDSVLFKWNNDDNWSINYVSQSVSRLLGYTQDEFLNGDVHYTDCIDKQDLQTVISEVEEGSKSDSKFFQHKPYKLITKDGEIKWVLDYTVVLKDDNGNTTHYLGYITDITGQKENERLIAEQSKLVAMGEMIGNIAHQWRQPLSVISTGATGLKIQKEYNTLTDEQFIKTCDAINDNAQYLSKTIDDFRNFIKGDSKIVEFNLSDDIESFLHLIEGSIKSNDIEIIKDIDENIIINGHPNELAQCFINIFNNSKDAFKDKVDDRFIFISTKFKNDNVVITFKDNAGGIPEDVLPKIFEPYFTTKHQSQGTGLGLHMTYNLIVDGMNGTIEAHNVTYEYNGKKHTGAEFKIILPLK